MNDAVDDSDDEVDYTKMDLGNKKVTMGSHFTVCKIYNKRSQLMCVTCSN